MTQSAAVALSPWWALGLILSFLALLIAAIALSVRLALRLRAARAQSAQLAGLIETVPEQALMLLDASGCVQHWAAAAERAYGYSAAGILGQHYAFLFTPGDRAAHVPENTLETAARDGPYVAQGWRVHRDGHQCRVDSRLQALREPSGRLVGFGVVESDIGDRLSQQQALTEARSTLAGAQKLAALGRLSEGIAHEFNNVVHVIKTTAALLQRRVSEDPQDAELLRMIIRNADRAADLSQHLLALSRRQPLNPVATDVNDVVGGVVALLRRTLSENIVVEEQLDEALTWVVVDRSELEAALLHVAANARDAMPAGGHLTFSTSEALQPAEGGDNGRPARHGVMISVEDVPDGGTAQRVKGAGHGAQADEWSLELVQALIEHTQGWLQIEQQGAGSKVNLYLPGRVG